jgi:hypothetical protein
MRSRLHTRTPLRTLLYGLSITCTLLFGALGPATLRAAQQQRPAADAAAPGLPAKAAAARRLPDSVRDLPPERVLRRDLAPAEGPALVPAVVAARPPRTAP